MRAARLIHLLVLIAFLPVATGCSKTSVMAVESDPDSAQEQFPASERIRIDGYALAGGEQVDWLGYVTIGPPDSLRFTPEILDPKKKSGMFGQSPPNPNQLPTTFTLPLGDVHSLSVVEPDRPRTILTAGVAILVLATAFFVGMAYKYRNSTPYKI
jgi:hypothetical protein